MNARSQIFDLEVEGRQVDEVVLSLFHTLLFHRSTGKFQYTNDDTYAVGTVGYQDVDCDFIDFTYLKCSSPVLDVNLKKELGGFCQVLRTPEPPHSGQVSLEFFQRKKGLWPFAADSITWEVWTLRINVVQLNNEHQRQQCRERVGECLGEKLLQITDMLNRPDYIPSPPNRSELDLIYDTSYTDIQPFLFKITYSTPSNPSVASTVKRIFRETLAFT